VLRSRSLLDKNQLRICTVPRYPVFGGGGGGYTLGQKSENGLENEKKEKYRYDLKDDDLDKGNDQQLKRYFFMFLQG